MSLLKEQIVRACSELGIEVVTECQVSIDEDVQLSPMACLPRVGAPRGMLIFGSFEEFRAHHAEIRDAGYGYAVLEEPMPDEEFDLNLYREIFRDWGWVESG